MAEAIILEVAFQCSDCRLIVETHGEPPDNWEYVELSPYGNWGWLCPDCQD